MALEEEPWDFVFGAWTGRDEGAPRPAPGWVEARPEVPVLLAHFVGVRREAAAALVPYLEAMAARPFGDPLGGPMHVDGAYGWFRASRPDLRALCAEPPVSRQRSSRSDIHAGHWADRRRALRPAMAALRGLKRRAQRLLGG